MVPPARGRCPSRAGDEAVTCPIVPAGTPATSDPDLVDRAEDHQDAGSIGGRGRFSREPVLGAAAAVVDPTVRRAAGVVADNEHAVVADPDPTLIAISRLGPRPLRRGSRPNRPAVIARSEADADGDQVRVGGVAVDAVSAGGGGGAPPGGRPRAPPPP